ncbi:MAG: sulfite exporter TauE/SafE family protein [Burkholderiales bacterium]|nr:sulfite exporter TauE/SafE family protein [Burkholderiales bacterium]
MGKAGFGMAGGVTVPLLALVIPPAQGAAIMLPILLVSDAASVYAYRRDWDRANMRILLPAGLAGTGIGWATFSALNDNALRIILGLIALGFVASSLARRDVPDAKPSRRKGWFWGTVSGVTSFIAQSGGAPLWIYLLPQRLEKRLQAGTTVMFFAALNVAKIVPYWSLDLLSFTNVSASLALTPVALLGIVIGVWLQNRMSEKLFLQVSYLILLLTGIQLLYDGISKL